MEVVKPRGRPNKTWKEVFVFDLRHLNLIAFDAMGEFNILNKR